MKKGFRSFCNGDGSTSTLNQGKSDQPTVTQSLIDFPYLDKPTLGESPPTLEEMILQLELEEKMARKAKLDDCSGEAKRRMSTGGRKSVCCNYELRKGYENGLNSELEKSRLPQTFAGECVVWCKPGVVAKLMGLDAMPVPVNKNYRKEMLSSIIKKQHLKRRAERREMEKRRAVMDVNGIKRSGSGMIGTCSTTGYCVMKPVAVEPANDEAGWPTRRFL
ncbi:hypothetical protein F0562_034550 [Nyssa sinensis]|uniref:DUF3741 domain-containing protein n=1 Tax=Nyssa sinensis TaxID=561372 RepID=A0A5J5AK42_9ASTE|nr:hypothetical protein F0562_034550 [Nyssa sinensis]